MTQGADRPGRRQHLLPRRLPLSAKIADLLGFSRLRRAGVTVQGNTGPFYTREKLP
jgi:hypothetical protein